MREILEPDTGKAFEFRNREADVLRLFRPRSSALGKTFEGSKPARVKTFRAAKRDYTGAKAFAQTRAARESAAVYPAETSRVIPNTQTTVPAGRIESGPAASAARGEFPSRAWPFSRTAEVRGTRQTVLDQQYGTQPALTVDQVRELLNKNK